MAKNQRPYKGDGKARRDSFKEGFITEGRIETCVQGIGSGDPFVPEPFRAYYGDHKEMGSEMLPTKIGGRGGAKESFRKKLQTGGN